MEKLNLNGRLVGPGEPPYIIAEIGANHNGDMDLCRKMIDAAKASGAHAVKFQSWTISSLISKVEYARNTEYANKKKHFGTLKEMVEKYQFTIEQHYEIAAYCKTLGIDFMSTGFSPEEVDLLDDLNVPAFKIASMDINHLPLLEYIANKERPVILSTGMATLGEIERAVHILQTNGSGPVAILHCISIYPPDHDTIHLRNIPMLQQTFDLPVGFSDHTLGTAIPLAAITLGASIIEKHFTLDKDMPGWDHAISANPQELEIIAREGLNIFQALGSYVRTVSDAEMKKRTALRRRLVVKRAMQAGEIIQSTDLDFKRPGNGIHPDELKYVVGRRLTRNVDADDELEWIDFS